MFHSCVRYLGMIWPRFDLWSGCKKCLGNIAHWMIWKSPAISSLNFSKQKKKITFKKTFHLTIATLGVHFTAVVSRCSHTLLYLKWVFYVDHHTGKVNFSKPTETGRLCQPYHLIALTKPSSSLGYFSNIIISISHIITAASSLAFWLHYKGAFISSTHTSWSLNSSHTELPLRH